MLMLKEKCATMTVIRFLDKVLSRFGPNIVLFVSLTGYIYLPLYTSGLNFLHFFPRFTNLNK